MQKFRKSSGIHSKCLYLLRKEEVHRITWNSYSLWIHHKVDRLAEIESLKTASRCI